MNIDLATQERKAKVREITGKDPTHVVAIELNQLREQGILIDLNVSGIGMLSKTLTWLETGINDLEGDKRAENYTKGMKLLYPEPIIRKLKSVESRMRQLIANYTFDITGFHPYRWLPFTAYDAWRSKFDALVAEFGEVKADMIEGHDRYVREMAVEYREIAEASWKSLTQGRACLKIERKGVIVSMSKGEYVESFVATTVAQIPSAEKIAERLQAGYITAMVYGSSDFAADDAKAQLLRERTRAEMERTRVENRRLNMRLEAEEARRRLDAREREIKIQAMRDAEMEHARTQLAQLASPFQEVFQSLRERFAADAQALLESIQKNGYVRGKVAEKGRGLIEFFDLMAIHDDDELRSALVSLKQKLEPSSSDTPRDTEGIKSILTQIADMADAETRDLTMGPTKFSIVDVG